MKRSREKAECPNPLFVKWLEEWKQEAVNRNSQIQYSFGKALDSLRKYPLPLSTGKDCHILKHFGDRLCAMIDKRLVQHNTLHNFPSTSAQNCIPLDDIIERKENKEQPAKACDNESNEIKKNKKKVEIKKRPFIPKIGSGAYAILITLYKKMEDPNYPGFMYKKDIIVEAQEKCDSQMKGTVLNNYSGWSAMTTLTEKDLVMRKSSPAKFSLTDAGIALAMTLVEGKLRHFSNSSDEDTKASNHSDRIKKSKNLTAEPRLKSTSSGSKSSEENDVFENTETPRLKLNSSKSKSPEADLNDFECLNSSPVHLDLMAAESPLKVCSTNNEIEDVIIICDDDDEDEVFKSDGMQNVVNGKMDYLKNVEEKNTDAVETKSSCSSEESFSDFCKENEEPVITIKKKESHFIFTEYLSLPGTSSGFNEKEDKIEVQITSDKTQPDCSTVNKNETDKVKKRKQKDINEVTTVSEKKRVASVEDNPTESFFLLANNFDIILLVDVQETSGIKTKPKDDATISELSKTGVLFEVRSLKVGDFTWIARCRFTNKELVFPYIVERKRIDDLSSSIRDGRYHEQKFRLRQSGIKNVIYLVENYGKNYHGAIPLSSLHQAAVNSLVQDNFTVKFTRNHTDSMRYLGTMTSMLTKIYEGKELTSCRKEVLQAIDSNANKNSEQLMEFTEFNKAAMKTKNFKVREMLIRQLLQLKGLSVDKAVAIAELYPTPKILADAFKNGDDKLLADIASGPSKRKIGPAISKTLYLLYTRHSFS